jgi:hypothetical protein
VCEFECGKGRAVRQPGGDGGAEGAEPEQSYATACAAGTIPGGLK